MVDRLRELNREHSMLMLAATGLATLLIVTIVLWFFVKPEGFKEKIAFIQIVSTIVGGATLVGGLLVNLRNLRITQDNLNDNQATALEQLENARMQLDITQKQLDLTRKGQTTEHFTKAIEQLGDDKTRIRLGGIYTLKQIAEQEESSDQRWQIIEILTAYVRDRASYDEKLTLPRQDYDIQVVLNVIRDFTRRFGAYTERDGMIEHYVDLSFSDLFGLDLSGMNLEWASLTATHLEQAQLSNATLKQATLQDAYLTRANLVGADMTFVDLRGAQLQGAHFNKAKLAGADFGAADLLGANFQEAELEATAHDELYAAIITSAQLEQVNGDTSEDQATILPQQWYAPSWWGKLPQSDGGYLPPGEYSIKVGKIPMSFHVDIGEEWYSQTVGSLPHCLTISPTGIGSTGPILSFFNSPLVATVDLNKPVENPIALSSMPPDLARWIRKEYGAYLDIGTATKVKPLIGGASGMQFEIKLLPGQGVTSQNIHGRGIPLFSQGRGAHFWINDTSKFLIIVLALAGETMTIVVESPEDEFSIFLESARKLLDTVTWLTTEQRQDEVAGD